MVDRRPILIGGSKNGEMWWGRVRGQGGRQRWISAVDLRRAEERVATACRGFNDISAGGVMISIRVAPEDVNASHPRDRERG